MHTIQYVVVNSCRNQRFIRNILQSKDSNIFQEGAGKKSICKAIGMIVNCWFSQFPRKKARTKGSVPNPFGQDCIYRRQSYVQTVLCTVVY